MDKSEVQKGITCSIELDGLMVNVKVVDTKAVFGRLDVLITPVSGNGEKWVIYERLEKI